jgi:hypothetical protein
MQLMLQCQMLALFCYYYFLEGRPNSFYLFINQVSYVVDILKLQYSNLRKPKVGRHSCAILKIY